ncbi:MAG: ATP-binding cassette domain-containing protein [Rhodothermales bacterium]|nr:ATP-binding cassette domain-containing protein [Rhodothermales bacterium]
MVESQTFSGQHRPPHSPSESVIRLIDVTKSFGEVDVLKGISFDVSTDSSAVIMGGSGSGKSVLIRSIVKLVTIDSGEVWIRGERVDVLDGHDLDRVRLGIGFLFQGGALFDSMTIAENMDFILHRHSDLDFADRRLRVEEILSWVDIVDKIDQYPSELSGGQKKRAALARALVLEPEIMIYDEPTTGLDPVSVRTVSELIVRLRDEQNITSLTITHDLECARIIADKVHFLYDGRILESGTLHELQRSGLPELRNFFGTSRF